VVCMTTYEPEAELLATQLASLRAQSDERWVCVISDDCSDEVVYERIAALTAGDERFTLTRSERRLGFYRNFERALTLIPDGAGLVALCDQDDRWHPEKLATLRASLGDAQMVYSDQRLVRPDGALIRETMWRGRSNNHTNIASLLIANTITGAATLMRREVAERALPFPETPGLQFHDHWLGLVALASGAIHYVERPLYDYVQHSGAVFGDVTHGPASRRRSRGWRAAYFCGFLSREVQAQTLLVRCAERLTAPKRRALERFTSAARSPTAFTWLILRVLRALAGHNETLASELDLAPGILWRWLIGPFARFCELTGRRSADATYPNPLDFEQRRIRRWRAGG
jgi:glycosyltransferase involved in cell wall biosynthesis